jgi:hypothetical protein
MDRNGDNATSASPLPPIMSLIDITNVTAGPPFIENMDSPSLSDSSSSDGSSSSDDSSDSSDSVDGTIYRYPIDTSLPWGVREWAGMGLATFVVVFGFALSLISSILRSREDRKRQWGTMLTEDGVKELLHVGWRYHYDDRNDDPKHNGPSLLEHPNDSLNTNNTNSNTASSSSPPLPPPQQQQEQQQQLYLQVYDRRESGYYNDENSMLKGGVEQEWINP